MKYYTIIRGMSSKKVEKMHESLFNLRLDMVMRAKEIGISQDQGL
jgi:hypothetical protein